MDWYVLLTPLLLLPIVSLLVFVGCDIDHHGGFEGVLVTIYWTPSQLVVEAKRLELWCDYEVDGAPPNKTKLVEVFNFSPGHASFHLGGSFQFGPFDCTCHGKVTRLNDQEVLASPSAPVSFTADSELEFQLQVVHPIGPGPTSFQLSKK